MTAIVLRYAFCNAPSHAYIEIRNDVVETAIAPASATLFLRSFQNSMVHISIILRWSHVPLPALLFLSSIVILTCKFQLLVSVCCCCNITPLPSSSFAFTFLKSRAHSLLDANMAYVPGPDPTKAKKLRMTNTGMHLSTSNIKTHIHSMLPLILRLLLVPFLLPRRLLLVFRVFCLLDCGQLQRLG